MKIRNLVYRGMRRFIQRDDASGLAPPVVEIRNTLTFLQEMEDAKELRDVPSWKASVAQTCSLRLRLFAGDS